MACTQYVTNQATRLIVKAAGDLAPQAVASLETSTPTAAGGQDDEAKEDEKHLDGDDSSVDSASPEEVDIDTYKPTILPDRRWQLSEVDLGQSMGLSAYYTHADVLHTPQSGLLRAVECLALEAVVPPTHPS